MSDYFATKKILKRWSEMEEKLILDNFGNIKDLHELCPLFPDRKYNSIKSQCGRMGLIKRRIHTKNENFFEIPNTINSSVAGAISSDGHIAKQSSLKSGNTISIAINAKDLQWIEDIKSATSSTHKIDNMVKRNVKISCGIKEYHYDIRHFIRLRFTNATKWRDDLSNNWKLPCGDKTLRIVPPDFNDIDISLAYISGLISGDGTIGLCRNKNKNDFRVSLLGTKELLDWVKLVFEQYLDKKLNNTVYQRGNIFAFFVCGANAILLFEKMNSLNVVKLKRKWENLRIIEYIKDFKVRNPNKFSQNSSQFPSPSVTISEEKI